MNRYMLNLLGYTDPLVCHAYKESPTAKQMSHFNNHHQNSITYQILKLKLSYT